MKNVNVQGCIFCCVNLCTSYTRYARWNRCAVCKWFSIPNLTDCLRTCKFTRFTLFTRLLRAYMNTLNILAVIDYRLSKSHFSKSVVVFQFQAFTMRWVTMGFSTLIYLLIINYINYIKINPEYAKNYKLANSKFKFNLKTSTITRASFTHMYSCWLILLSRIS